MPMRPAAALQSRQHGGDTSGKKVLCRDCNEKKEQTKMNNSKVLLTYDDGEGNYQVESVWATKQGSNYRIDNIPFFAPNIALGDLVSIEEDEGELHFESLVQPSGHSTVQMIIFDENKMLLVGSELENLGCTWEGSHIKNLISIDIPKNIDYGIVKQYLDKGEKENHWSYKEACLAHNKKAAQ